MDKTEGAEPIAAGWTRTASDSHMTLETSPEIAAATRAQARDALQGLDRLFGEAHAAGPLSEQPPEFVIGLVAALAVTTMQFMASEPADRERRCRAGFDAAWLVIAGHAADTAAVHSPTVLRPVAPRESGHER